MPQSIIQHSYQTVAGDLFLKYCTTIIFVSTKPLRTHGCSEMISYGLVYQKGPEMEKKGIFAPPYGYLSDIFLPSASGYVLATSYRYDIDRENPKMFAGKIGQNAPGAPTGLISTPTCC